MSLTIDHANMDGKIVFDTESRRYPTLKAYPAAPSVGSYAYLGLFARADMIALAKAILNALEPEALVENQHDAEPEGTLWGYRVGDEVRYTATGFGPEGWVRTVSRIEGDRLALTDGAPGDAGYAYSPSDIEPASAPTPARDLAAEVDRLTARVDALEAAADTEIRVGDTVRVAPDDWNIGGAFLNYETVTGVVDEIDTEGTGGRYYVTFKYPAAHARAGAETRIWAFRATKVAPRG